MIQLISRDRAKLVPPSKMETLKLKLKQNFKVSRSPAKSTNIFLLFPIVPQVPFLSIKLHVFSDAIRLNPQLLNHLLLDLTSNSFPDDLVEPPDSCKSCKLTYQVNVEK